MTASCPNTYLASRKRLFVLKPPRIWPFGRNFPQTLSSENFYKNRHSSIVVYTDEEIIAYRSSSYLVFQGQVLLPRNLVSHN